MNYSTIPIIVILCYLIGEIYKVIFMKNKELYRLIPIITAFTGGIIGILIYLTDPNIINATSIWYSLEIGIVSGASSTGLNQVIKNIIKEKEGKNYV